MASTRTTKVSRPCPAYEESISSVSSLSGVSSTYAEANSAISSTSATPSSLNCCAQVEQVRANNDLRLSIAKAEQLVCEAAHKAQKRQEVFDNLKHEFKQVQEKLGINKGTKEDLLKQNQLSAEELELKSCESRRLKKEAQKLQDILKTQRQQICDLEQQIKINGEEFLAATNSINQKLCECKNAIEKLTNAKATIDLAVQKAGCDLQSSSSLLIQSRLALENILTKIEKYQTQLPELQQEITRTRQACQENQQDVASLRANNVRARTVLEDVVQEAERYRGNAEAVQEAMKTSSCEAGCLQEAVDQLKEQQREAEKAMGEKQQKLVKLSEQLKDTEVRCHDAVRQLSQAKERYNSLHERYIGLVREQAC